MELSSDSEEEDVHSPPVYTLSDGEEDGENEVKKGNLGYLTETGK